MTLKEIRMVKHLVASAREMIEEDGAIGLLISLEAFEKAVWRNDADRLQMKLTPQQMQRCVAAAYAELKHTGA